VKGAYGIHNYYEHKELMAELLLRSCWFLS